MTGQAPPPVDLEKLAQSLSAGFEALLGEAKALAQREAILRKSLDVAKKEVRTITFSLCCSTFSMTRNQD
jgi:hypothetical protein